MKFRLGQVVCCYPDRITYPDFGVVVKLPSADYPYYRVRISTKNFQDYVELGVAESDLNSRD